MCHRRRWVDSIPELFSGVEIGVGHPCVDEKRSVVAGGDDDIVRH